MSTSTASNTARTPRYRLQVATELYRFIEDHVLPGTGVASSAFWKGFDGIVADLAPKNIALLAERDRLQAELDAWHKANPGPIADMPAYHALVQRLFTEDANVRNVKSFFSIHRAKFDTRVPLPDAAP